MPTAKARSYQQHHPEDTPLFSLVKEHLPSFLKASEYNYKSGLPKYVTQVIRYCARAPLSLERLSVSEDGKVVYQLKHPIRGRTHRVMEPHQFLARLCALIPPPRHPLIRFYGVFGPASKWRAEVVPGPQPKGTESSESNAPESTADEIQAATQTEAQWQSGRLDWATLLHRVYDIDALRCECGGDIRFEELIEEPKKAKAFLALHNIESPRASSPDRHIKPWSDAPNIALATAQQNEPTATPEARAPANPEFQSFPDYKAPATSAPNDESAHQDQLPSEESYFHDEIPPD